MKKNSLLASSFRPAIWLKNDHVQKITDAPIEGYSNLKSIDDYFKGYIPAEEDLNRREKI